LLERAIESVDTVVWSGGRLLPSSPVEALAEIDDLSPLVVLLRLLADRPRTRLIFLSSAGTVYGPDSSRPTKESGPLLGATPYAAVKIRSERWIDEFRREHGVDAVVLRVANAYGARQPTHRPQGIVAHAFECIARRRRLEVFSDPASTRDYVYLDDVLDVVFECCARSEVPRAMNVASGQATRLGDLLAMIELIAGELLLTRATPRGVDIEHSELDVGVLRSFMPDFEATDLENGLAATWRCWQNDDGR
jgi:UDP-glucose 4-epimerase